MSQTSALSHHTCTVRPRSTGILSLLDLWQSRRQLASLDASQLADIGVTPREAAAEAARAPWDVPAHWRD